MTKPIGVLPRMLLLFAAFFALIIPVGAQQPASQPAGARFDITNYRIEAQLIPEQHMLRAGADVTLVPQEPTRSLIFELNGSLRVESVERDGKPLTGLVQDPVETRGGHLRPGLSILKLTVAEPSVVPPSPVKQFVPSYAKRTEPRVGLVVEQTVSELSETRASAA